MNIPVRNLVSRHNQYYFRCRLPKGQPPYGLSLIPRDYTENSGALPKSRPSEIKISLRTSDLKTAVSMGKVMTERFENLVSTGSIYGMTLSEIRKILTAEISRLLEDHARQLADYGEMCATTRREGMEKALSMMKFFERQRDNGCPEGKIAAAQLLKDIPHSESDINFMAREWTLAQISLMRMQHDCIAWKRALTEYRDTIYDEVKERDLTFLRAYCRYRPDWLGQRLRKAHPVIAHYFCSGAGLYLQRIDSEIMRNVLLRLAEKDIPCLPVHDSAIVQYFREWDLRREMNNAYRGMFPGFWCGIEKKCA